MLMDGLSPRVRGNRGVSKRVPGCVRSIPACAGEPIPVDLIDWTGGVYPRVCGGTQPGHDDVGSPRGLSPRVRGNRGEGDTGTAPNGSIPACAGEPGRGSARIWSIAVYPRVCGGTAEVIARNAFRVGLSPRVRGNQGRAGDSYAGLGSIPACAGEPGVNGIEVELHGSIPACAGEPVPRSLSLAAILVYPRVCGGTGVNP